VPPVLNIENLIAVPIYLQNAFSGVVGYANSYGGFDDYDDEVLLAVGDQVGIVLQNSRLWESCAPLT
jgi:GAF domain-containing protein